MSKNFFIALFVLCLIKLFHISYKSVNFSPNLLFNSFQENAGEDVSLGFAFIDVVPIRNYFKNENISEFNISEEILKNHQIYYQRIVELSYPVKMNIKSSTLVALKSEDLNNICELLKETANLGVYECK